MEIRIYFGKTPTDNAKFFTRADFMDWYNRISQKQYVSIQTDEIITPFSISLIQVRTLVFHIFGITLI